MINSHDSRKIIYPSGQQYFSLKCTLAKFVNDWLIGIKGEIFVPANPRLRTVSFGILCVVVVVVVVVVVLYSPQLSSVYIWPLFCFLI